MVYKIWKNLVIGIVIVLVLALFVVADRSVAESPLGLDKFGPSVINFSTESIIVKNITIMDAQSAGDMFLCVNSNGEVFAKATLCV